MSTSTLQQELRGAAWVYGSLLALTALTVGASLWHAARIPAVLVALLIASIKAALIAWHFMHLKSERPLVWIILATGLLSVVILVIGVFPDLAWKLQ